MSVIVVKEKAQSVVVDRKSNKVVVVKQPSKSVIVVRSKSSVVVVRPKVASQVITSVRGPSGMPGAPGAQGPAGVPGQDGSGVSNFTYSQDVPASIWNITHTLGFYPAVTVVDSAGTVVEGDISYPDVNTVVLMFVGSFSGKAYLS